MALQEIILLSIDWYIIKIKTDLVKININSDLVKPGGRYGRYGHQVHFQTKNFGLEFRFKHHIEEHYKTLALALTASSKFWPLEV